MKIAIQGIPGSFSEIATQVFATKHHLTKYEPYYLINSENVLAALENDDCDYGIFALENSTGGVVIETIYALAKHRCTIQEFFHISVVQCLMTRRGLNANQITAVYSHHQALRQCKNYLATHYPQQKIIETADTALAAKQLQLGELPETAAVIGNKLCAELYDLQLLETAINDLKDNQTQFIAATPFKEKI